MKWNISVIKGKKINRDSKSSGSEIRRDQNVFKCWKKQGENPVKLFDNKERVVR